MIDIIVTGVDAAVSRLRSIASGMAALGTAYATVGTNVNYARAVHDGARGRAGRPFLTDALQTKAASVRIRLDTAVNQLMDGAPEAVLFDALLASALDTQAEAQRNTPVLSGTLRRSEHTELFRR
jgi:hypothetical protein